MSEEKKTAPIRDQASVERRVAGASSQILDIIGLKGQAQPSEPFPLACSGYASEEGVIRMRHPWSFYGASDTDLRAAIGRLRKDLPTSGWKIVKDGTDGSQVDSPQIIANSDDGQLSVDLVLSTEPAGGEYKSSIEVVVVSTCFRQEPGATPSAG
ncbi:MULTISPECIES: hypothetical protein [Streptomyces]|uniref:Uncharacterized protein n=2 Tax=Streptomyces TaxID=1883 RepID=A0A652KZ70_9ACTN|nr:MULTISPECIES: hypothetical protein [unclassified Streptomyces]MDX3323529.1 hypothetical protein [Streptomyces sp. ME02-6979-3A]MDX3427768.1 hypothetical protein [Streptomyces sp. ME01-18a]MDX3684136.1 hypothetical protein [Streptomyces sp. AK04-4c]TXS28228.1 hypothetical protein EAO74_20210 [Streptomyces sp. gb1(2016)]